MCRAPRQRQRRTRHSRKASSHTELRRIVRDSVTTSRQCNAMPSSSSYFISFRFPLRSRFSIVIIVLHKFPFSSSFPFFPVYITFSLSLMADSAFCLAVLHPHGLACECAHSLVCFVFNSLCLLSFFIYSLGLHDEKLSYPCRRRLNSTTVVRRCKHDNSCCVQPRIIHALLLFSSSR